MDLHGNIMNIKATSTNLGKAIDTVMGSSTDLEKMLALAYKLGHKDARHEAAEMALQSGSPAPTNNDCVYTEKDVLAIIKKCFTLGQGGWNEAEDEPEYISKALKYAATKKKA